MSEFLFEIGCEEIPARMLPEALTELAARLSAAFAEAGLACAGLETHGTPRRMMAAAADLADAQADRVEERRGPPLARAFDANGAPTQAALGFARSCGVEMAELEKSESDKGGYLICRLRKSGRPTVEILPELLLKLLTEFPWPKSMRWGAGRMRFVRPVHALLVLFGGKLLPVTTADGLASGDQAAGHRFHAPAARRVASVAEYRQVLEEGRVLLPLAAREERIRDGVAREAAEVHGRPVADAGLVTENACLTEWPVPILGRFDPAFLAIPREVLITSMRSHQKYFSVEDENGRLMPCFVAVSNLEAPDRGVVRAGFERVLRARLSDARFFWEEDGKRSLESHLEALRGIVYQERLGTVHAKMERVRRLSVSLAGLVEAEATVADRAALLAKCDLVTGMVGEFPELQGVMGAYYARSSGEPEAVAVAIREHYLPLGAAGDLPASAAGVALALADKLDTLTGCFAIGLAPTGAKDPFALRRAALGVIRILLAGGVSLSLKEVLVRAYRQLPASVPNRGEAEVVEALLAFFYGRLESHLKAEGLEYDLIEAVSALGLDDLVDAVARVRALRAFKGLDSCAALVAANKRIVNILEKSAGGAGEGVVRGEGLVEEAEKALHRVLEEKRARAAAAVAGRDYQGALFALSELRAPIDLFFDQVMVMDPDPALRANRLALVASVRGAFRQVGEISRLVMG